MNDLTLPVDYDDLIRSCENVASITRQWDFGTYQGDMVYLLAGVDGRIGLTVIGYGSCSGCDALQACDTNEEVTALRDSFSHEIKWFATLDDLKHYVASGTARNEWYVYAPDWEQVRQDIAAL